MLAPGVRYTVGLFAFAKAAVLRCNAMTMIAFARLSAIIFKAAPVIKTRKASSVTWAT